MNVKLTTNSNSTKQKLIVNWDNVDFARETQSVYGDTYVEVNFGNQYIDVKETLEEIEVELANIKI